MAKGGPSKNISAEEHEARRHAAKDRKKVRKNTGAQSNAQDGYSDILQAVRSDKLKDFMERGRERRELEVQLAPIGHLTEGMGVHAVNSATFVQAMLAAEAAERTLELYEATDPLVRQAGNGYIKVLKPSFEIAAQQVRHELSAQGHRAVDYGIAAAQTALQQARQANKSTNVAFAN